MTKEKFMGLTALGLLMLAVCIFYFAYLIDKKGESEISNGLVTFIQLDFPI